MTALFGILGSRFAGYLGIGASVILTVLLARAQFTIWDRDRSIDTLSAKVDDLTPRLAACMANTSTLQSAVDGQNSTIEQFKATGERQRQAAEDAIKRLAAAQSRGRTLANQVLEVPPQDDACKAAYDILGKAGR